MRNSLILVFTAALIISCSLKAAEAPIDPFESQSPPTDPFSSKSLDEEADSQDIQNQYRIELKGYYQNNDLRDFHPFNPLPDNVKLFEDNKRFIGLDFDLETNWSAQWSTKLRTFSRYLDTPDTFLAPGEDKDDENNSWLLEGFVNWQSLDHKLSIKLGRSKPQWSGGYSYDIANLLHPQRNRPFIDQDNPLQSKGWDMFDVQYIYDNWSFSGYVVKSESPYFDADIEAVLRLGLQGDNTFSLLAHKIEGSDLAWAATWSRLLTDNISLRAEWTAHPYRQMEIVSVKERDLYHRFVIGTNYTADDGWSLLVEYFYNQHGASETEWMQISQAAESSAQRVRNSQSDDFLRDFSTAFAGLDLMRAGWLQQRYVSLMFMSAESENLWQLRLSAQLNLEDDSYLSRVEILKSFHEHFSSRIQFESFDGCELCEYGLNPSDYAARVVVSWLF